MTDLKPKDFASTLDVRWCPGCGDYAVLKSLQKILSDTGAKLEDTLCVSGIGCSSRLPYYMATYGFHSIHGRAPAVATGAKLANPELDVWVFTGDGDGLSIGGNHLMHALRRNLDMQIVLFNNQIYGLTKGQFSPTSQKGLRTPSSPGGSVDTPLNPVRFAIGAGAKFIARSVDTQAKVLGPVLQAARTFEGTAFVDVLQNCVIFNDGVFDKLKDKKQGPDHTLFVEHGQPLVFGVDRNKGIRIKAGGFSLEVVSLEEGGLSEADLIVHDETNHALAGALAELGGNAGEPTVLGILFREEAPEFGAESRIGLPAKPLSMNEKLTRLSATLRKAETWDVGEDEQ
ncbi:2-oxoglutarate oxidoreductase subunit KorB [Pseudovibrio axinellae]|uniref:2-oxoglutarate oxidoreductase subunit KorB n=1 Tax=Pseudovibrio axinellae TaxID=989403 RepID=A0A165Z180_9HYPH|nr:2-oxoacid:ferredoxin oxidoreductase subunit beta [Pseudovibrio axinellae]KZL19422.1 2-oxoglutarate oxidoreductase subunit KorB [Pseudovibrio axinellae]SER59432.1 2-oxoglutarate ferredoxin oxidoreductase subunit beta [Pseudovibrio axinellae]